MMASDGDESVPMFIVTIQYDSVDCVVMMVAGNDQTKLINRHT